MTATRSLIRSVDIPKRIGIDFDNTTIGYDGVFLSAAKERGLLPHGFVGAKQAIRDAIRLLPDGELAWQKLQGYTYGNGIGGAVMFDGMDRFLLSCRRAGHSVFIVSHKTEFGHFDPSRTNLREAALGWMREHGFFRQDGYAIPTGNVFFESTRSEKIRRIAELGCTHFVDDLEEVLSDPEFPPNVERILFGSGAPTGRLPYPVYAAWQDIEKVLFDERS